MIIVGAIAIIIVLVSMIKETLKFINQKMYGRAIAMLVFSIGILTVLVRAVL